MRSLILIMSVLMMLAAPLRAECVFGKEPSIQHGKLTDMSGPYSDYSKRPYCRVQLTTNDGRVLKGVAEINAYRKNLCEVTPGTPISFQEVNTCCDTGPQGVFGCGLDVSPTTGALAAATVYNQVP